MKYALFRTQKQVLSEDKCHIYREPSLQHVPLLHAKNYETTMLSRDFNRHSEIKR